MDKTFEISLAVVIVLLATAGGFYWYGASMYAASSRPAFNSIAELNAQTRQANPVFASAVRHEQAGDYAGAIPDLQTALASATNSYEALTIKFHLEYAYEVVGNYVAAARLLQQMAADPSAMSTSRAFAAEMLARLYQNVRTPELTATLFTEVPYKDMYVATSTNLTTRHLFQYATTFRPLPISQYYIANSYANSILNQHLESDTSDPVYLRFKQRLDTALKAGDSEMSNITRDPPNGTYVLSAKLVRAIVLGKLEQIGDTSYGDADTAFRDVLAAYTAQKLTNDGIIRLQYAYYLSSTSDPNKDSKIQNVLAPIISDSAHRGPFMVPLLKTYRQASTSKASIVSLAAADPQFKSLLLTLGWTEADFK